MNKIIKEIIKKYGLNEECLEKILEIINYSSGYISSESDLINMIVNWLIVKINNSALQGYEIELLVKMINSNESVQTLYNVDKIIELKKLAYQNDEVVKQVKQYYANIYSINENDICILNIFDYELYSDSFQKKLMPFKLIIGNIDISNYSQNIMSNVEVIVGNINFGAITLKNKFINLKTIEGNLSIYGKSKGFKSLKKINGSIYLYADAKEFPELEYLGGDMIIYVSDNVPKMNKLKTLKGDLNLTLSGIRKVPYKYKEKVKANYSGFKFTDERKI